MKYNLLFIHLFICQLAFGSELDSLRSEKRGDQWYVIHQVESGETLYAITKRYKADINQVIAQNKIQNNSIQVGQILEIPIKTAPSSTSTPAASTTKPKGKESKVHVVAAGETLFAISRKYDVKVEDIVAWNRLQSESLSIGQELQIGGAAPVNGTTTKPTTSNEPVAPFANAIKHYVQFGETLESIAGYRKVAADSLKKWNGLPNSELRIGQILWYRNYPGAKVTSTKREVYGKRIEEGIAMQIDEVDFSDKYLALHRTIPVGTLLEVRNLMNNKKVYVRVVGNLPATGINDNVMVRLTAKSFERLGILDARARVEISYYEE